MHQKTQGDLSSWRAAVFVLAAVFVGGCTLVRTSDPARTATEQLLISTAADHAMQSQSLDRFAGQKVFLDTTYFDSYDPKYAMGTIRDALCRAGALLQENITNSDIVIEVRAGALSTDSSTWLLGIPSTSVPTLVAGSLAIPEIAPYKASHDRGVARILLLAYGTKSREHIYSSGAMDGKSYKNDYKLLWVISWTRTDVPEIKKTKKQKEEEKKEYPFQPLSVN
jgi:hypothetical protein